LKYRSIWKINREPEEDDDGTTALNDSESGIESTQNRKRRSRYYILSLFF
jgi:hypothetical protein